MTLSPARDTSPAGAGVDVDVDVAADAAAGAAAAAPSTPEAESGTPSRKGLLPQPVTPLVANLTTAD